MFRVEWSSREKKLLALLVVVILIALFSIIWNLGDETNSNVPLSVYSPMISEKKEKVAESEEPAQDSSQIVVDVKGEVVKPGIYKLNSQSRVYDAIQQAGGAQKQADLNQVNLAQQLTDGMVVYVPKKGENQNQNNISFSGAQKPVSTKINVNTASAKELEQLDGIGKSKAEAIVRYREEHGKFNSLEDLKKVPGIGDSTVENFREQIIF